ncbi:MAG: Nramp family divalent metal transporter [Caldisericum sp.]|uniref:Mg2+/Co2+ transporter n=2 Tax=Caldisericum exile TaxID=693075 RepID=A0A2J6WE91_9BACT|nr:MAG: Mg2+/Co2+ transporter [Caldisericum exile]
MENIKRLFQNHKPRLEAFEILKYIGPGFLVTVGFIDPGNWASNVAAGSMYGYKLLWMVTLSTIMLIILQHNAAHLGIATGLCLAESFNKFYKKPISTFLLVAGYLATISTTLAEVLGASIGLKMLFRIPIKFGAIITSILILFLVLTNSYTKIERIIIGFVSLIGLSFLIELFMVGVDVKSALLGWIVPSVPTGSELVVMSVLGAVVMPHNLFLHSEIIQSRQWNLQDEKTIQKQLSFEFLDTIFSMFIGFLINSAMIIVAAQVFFKYGIKVSELETAQATLKPLLGNFASIVFAIALLFSGISSSITAVISSGIIVSGASNEPFDTKDNHSRIGIISALVFATLIIFFLKDTFKGLIISQAILSIELPFTVLGQITLTSSELVMGKYKNRGIEKALLVLTFAVVTILNLLLLLNIGKV